MESNRRPSPYHAGRLCLAVPHQVALLLVRGIVVSGCVALQRWLPEAVATGFVTDSASGIAGGATRSNQAHQHLNSWAPMP
jgi:hypothetical protein